MTLKGKRGPRPEELPSGKDAAAGKDGEPGEAQQELGKELTEEKLKGKELPETGVKGTMLQAIMTGKIKRDRHKNLLVTAEFETRMNDAKSKILPPRIRDAWAMMRVESYPELGVNTERMGVQVVEAAAFPEAKTRTLRAVAPMDRVTLREVKEGNGREIELRFSITRGVDDELWDWLRINCGCPLWVRVRKAQGELLDQYNDEIEAQREKNEGLDEAEQKKVVN